MKQAILLLALLIGAAGHSYGQSPTQKPTPNERLLRLQDTLQQLGYQYINNPSDLERTNANYQFIKKLVQALKIPNSYAFDFDSLKMVSIKRSPDDQFRILSWSTRDNAGNYRYYGTIQLNNPNKLEMYPLVDYSSNIKKPADTLTTNDKWYGAQYYKIIPYKAEGVNETYYTLLGWKGNNQRTTKRIIDVLQFKDGKAWFGKPIFDGTDMKGKKRVIFEYTQQASMFLNYNPGEGMIVFDHLAPSDEKLKGQYEFYGPDFTYNGFKKMLNGRWKLIENLDLKNPPDANDELYNDPVKLRKPGTPDFRQNQ